MPTDENRKRKRKKGGWRQYDGRNLHDPNLWKSGDPLTEADEAMLEEIRKVYRELGYVPSRREVPAVPNIKKRFRLWRIALEAAGLPDYEDPDETRRRMAIQDARKREARRTSTEENRKTQNE